MALKPQPVYLDPHALCAVVTHDNFDTSPPQWVVLAAKAQSGAYLDKSRWDFNESITPGATRDATVTLAPDATDQIDRLKCGEQIVLYVSYAGTARAIDPLAVRMRGL